MTIAREISTQGHVSCLVAYKVLGPQQGKQYSQEYSSYLVHNGPEWTCQRYKAIYTAARHLANGDPEMARRVYNNNSIAYHKDTMYPKGASKIVVERFVESSRPSVKRRYAGLLRSYTDLTLPHEPTKAQSEKAIHSIKDKGEGRLNNDQAFPRLARSFRERWRSLDSKTRSEIADARHTMPMHSTSYYYHNVPLKREFVESLKDRPYGQFMLSMLTESWIPESLEGQSRSDLPRQEQYWEYGVDSGFAGRILGMQQQGCKLRVVAQPTAELQLAFAPLHKSLQLASASMFPKEDCVEYQEKGIRAALDHLRDGHPVYSVDLSSATDRFPRRFSQHLLEMMGLERYSKALEDVCNRPWENSNLQGPNQLYYEVGQPMGLYGSFPLFNLSNLAIADEAVNYAILKGAHVTPFRDGTFFKVVGDDIILSDPKVSSAYCGLMKELGCKVSPEKTFKGQVAEFAGFIAIPSNEGYTAFRPYKFPTGEWISNPMDYIHAFGVKASKGPISEKQRERWEHIFDAYSRTFSSRNLDLTPILWEEEKNPIRLVGKEPWLESLVNAISLEISETEYSRSRTLLCAQEWLNERSGYAFANETFPSDVVSSLVPQTASRLDDVQFTPQMDVRLDKESKRKSSQHFESKAIEDFWRDPLNARFKDQVLNPNFNSLSVSFEDRLKIASVRSKFENLTAPKSGTKSRSLDQDLTR